MGALTGKNILLISPQGWGKMHLSKHHYALELVQRGNRVYFLNPPQPGLAARVEVARHEEQPELYLVSYRPFFNFLLRYHSLAAYRLLLRLQVGYLLRRLEVRFDVVWCFDTNLYPDLRRFRAEFAIYHVVDQVIHPNSLLPAVDADLLLTVAEEIAAKFPTVQGPKLIVNHGLSRHFAQAAQRRLETGDFPTQRGDRVKVGYVGNLLIHSLDRPTLTRILEENREVDFHFWGSHDWRSCNLSGDFVAEDQRYVEYLQQLPHVRLHGPREPGEVAQQIQEMDAFLICYDLDKDLNGGANSHKILEYLSTGKVVVANRITSYRDHAHLIRMCPDLANRGLPALFRETVRNLDRYNAVPLQRERVELSLENSYARHIERVAALIAAPSPERKVA